MIKWFIVGLDAKLVTDIGPSHVNYSLHLWLLAQFGKPSKALELLPIEPLHGSDDSLINDVKSEFILWNWFSFLWFKRNLLVILLLIYFICIWGINKVRVDLCLTEQNRCWIIMSWLSLWFGVHLVIGWMILQCSFRSSVTDTRCTYSIANSFKI